ncbi:hypothetical protein BELL_0211g00010 [Botrytis elliptica]|uniref:Uncharacterized protein n=1 Tax=Botrytis elliptica TaxID=278938 RepID=A0A4Z1JQ47_9HELO|nr:hypothetical protein EAE99_008860 [Botrytis elliptica]TGO75464.1 hypothetical protein BELL_0211g00010 [Botrytis elliptica]
MSHSVSDSREPWELTDTPLNRNKRRIFLAFQDVFKGDNGTYPTQKQIRQIVDENFEAKSAYLDGLNPKKISEKVTEILKDGWLKPDSPARKRILHVSSSGYTLKTIINSPLEKENCSLEVGTTSFESGDNDKDWPQDSENINGEKNNIPVNKSINTDGAAVLFQPPHETDKFCSESTENTVNQTGELLDAQSVQEHHCRAYNHLSEGISDTDQVLRAPNSCKDNEISISPVVKKSFKRRRRNSELDFGQPRSKRARFGGKTFVPNLPSHDLGGYQHVYERLMNQPDIKLCDQKTQCRTLKEANEALTTACYEWCARYHSTRLREMKWLRRSKAQLHLFHRNVIQWEISMNTLKLVGNQRISSFLSLLNAVVQIRHSDIHDDKELPIQLLDIMMEDAVNLAIMVRDPAQTQRLEDLRDHVRLEDPMYFFNDAAELNDVRSGILHQKWEASRDITRAEDELDRIYARNRMLRKDLDICDSRVSDRPFY